jgi:hypothetical protein
MAKKHMKKCLTSLATKEMKIKIMLRFHLTTVRMATIKNMNNDKCWWECGERGTLINSWWECKLYTTTMENSTAAPQKTKNRAAFQQNNGKPNSTTHQKDYSPRPSKLHPRYAGVVQHTKINKRNKPH